MEDKNEQTLNFFKGDELATTVWLKKYKFGNEQTPEDSKKRHLNEIAEVEMRRLCGISLYQEVVDKLSEYGKLRYQTLCINRGNKEEVVKYLGQWVGLDKILLGGSMMQGIGNHNFYSSLSNCFVLGRPYDSYAGIAKLTDEMAQVMKRRGGAGIDLSSIRPNQATVHNQSGFSSGPVLFANRYSNITLEVAQYGRRGALMLSIHINHPDSIAFAEEKQDLSKLTGCNSSIIFSDEFMQAVESNSDYLQRFPVDIPAENFKVELSEIEYDTTIPCRYFDGNVMQSGYVRKINAKKIWEKITEFARNTAEPGIIFEENWYQGGTDSVYDDYKPVTTNPCFAGDMTILTEDGFKTFRELCGKKDIVFINAEGEKVTGSVWSNGVKKVVQVKFKGNQIVENTKYVCTPNHQHLIYDGNHKYMSVDEQTKEFKNGYSLLEIQNCIDETLVTARIGDEIGKYNYPTVTEIIDAGEEEVFDFHLDIGKPYGVISELGIMAHNCSEIPMQPYDSCRLMSVNLYSLVNNPFTNHSMFDFDQAYMIFYEQMTTCDIVVDLEADYIKRIIEKIQKGKDPEELKEREISLWQKILDSGQRGRRCGCGFTALGDCLAALGLKYDTSDMTMNFIKKLFMTKLEAELDATTDMSILYGCFDGWGAPREYDWYHDDTMADDDFELEGKTKFFQMLYETFPEKVKKMCRVGRRNVSWSTAAPTGSLSILSQTTSGIEPLFSPFYMRRKKCIDDSERVDYIDPADGQKFTMFPVFHPKFKYWIENFTEYHDASTLTEEEVNTLFEKSPWYGCCANDIDWNDRVKIQALVQTYTTHAISSTINLPSDISPVIVKEIYTASWKHGLKGNTIYREGSRGGVLINTSNQPVSDNEFEETRAPKRPIRLPSVYHTIRAKRKVYSVIIGFFAGKPYEVFIASGIDNLPENLDDTTDHIDGELVKEGKDWYNFESETFILKEIPDVESEEKMLSLMISMALRHRTPLKFVIKTLDKTKPIAGSFTHRLIKILSKYVPDGEDSGQKCPDCGEPLRFENGCVLCPTCGWSKC